MIGIVAGIFWEATLVHEHGHFEHLLHSVAVANAATILSIVWFSFVMSWHCAAMCGPLVCGGFSNAGTSRREIWIGVLLYNFGRMISYALVGAMIGAIAQAATDILPMAGAVLSLTFATILGAQGFSLLLNREFVFTSTAMSRLASNLSQCACKKFRIGTCDCFFTMHDAICRPRRWGDVRKCGSQCVDHGGLRGGNIAGHDSTSNYFAKFYLAFRSQDAAVVAATRGW